MVTSLASILQRKKDLEAQSKQNMFEGISKGNQSANTYANNLVAVERAKEAQEFNPVNALIGTVAGAGKGFVASGGNPLGAVAGGVAGAVGAPTGRKIRPISSATGGYSRGAGVVSMADDFGGDMEKAGTYLAGFKDKPEEAMAKIGKITQDDIDAKTARDNKINDAKTIRENKIADAKTKHEYDKELVGMRKANTKEGKEEEAKVSDQKVFDEYSSWLNGFDVLDRKTKDAQQSYKESGKGILKFSDKKIKKEHNLMIDKAMSTIDMAIVSAKSNRSLSDKGREELVELLESKKYDLGRYKI